LSDRGREDPERGNLDLRTAAFDPPPELSRRTGVQRLREHVELAVERRGVVELDDLRASDSSAR
jgi:hypothetical protein